MKANDIKWQKRFESVEKYINETGNIPKYSTKYDDELIGSWLHTQQKALILDKLTEERKEALERIGIVLKLPEKKNFKLREVLNKYNKNNKADCLKIAESAGFSYDMFKKYIQEKRNLSSVKVSIYMSIVNSIGCKPLEIFTLDINELKKQITLNKNNQM